MKQAPVPPYDFTLEQRRSVYLPDEDTFLLMDCIYNYDNQPAESVLEIGSGSGVMITFLSLHFRPKMYQCRDINEKAVEMTNQTLKMSNFQPVCTQNDMFDELQSGQKFDLVVFNPPYCVDDHPSLGIIDRALSGGKNGRREIDRFIEGIREILSEGGRAYLVCIEANNVLDILKKISENRMEGEVMGEKRLSSEHLYVLRVRARK